MTLSDTKKSALVRNAEEAFHRNDFLVASKTYKEILSKDPRCATTHLNLGRTLAARGRHQEAVESLKKAIELGKNTGAVYRDLAISYHRLGNFDRSHDNVERMLQIESDTPTNYLLAAQLYSDEHHYTQAIDYCCRATKIDSQYTEAWLQMAVDMENLDRHDKALEAFQSALCIAPTRVTHRYWQVLSAIVKGGGFPCNRIDQIAKNLPPITAVWRGWASALQSAEITDAGCVALVHALEVACDEKQRLEDHPTEEAESHLSLLRSAVSNTIEDLIDVLRKNENMGPYEEQVANHLKQLKWPRPLDLWTRFLWMAKRFESAIELFGWGIRVFCEHSCNEFYSIMELIDQDNVQEFAPRITEAVKTGNRIGANIGWAEKLIDLECFSDAEDILRQLIDGTSQCPQAHHLLSLLYASQNEHEKAYQEVLNALEIYSKGQWRDVEIDFQSIIQSFFKDHLERTKTISGLVHRLNRGHLHVAWAKTLLALNAPGKALAHTLAAAELGYKIDDYMLDRVLIEEQVGKIEPLNNRLADWERFVRRNNNFEDWIQLARVLKGHRHEQALFYLQQVVDELLPADPLLVDAARVYIQLDAPGIACRCFRDHIKMTVRPDPQVYSEWAEALVASAKNRQTKGYISSMVESIESWKADEQLEDTIPKIDWDAIKRNRLAHEAQIKELVETIVCDVDNSDACNEVASILYEHHAYWSAEALLKHAYTLNPQNARTPLMLGWSLLQQNRLSEAQAQFCQAIALDPGNWSAHYGKAHVASRLNDFAQMDESYRRTIEMLDDDVTARSSIHEQWSMDLTYAGQLDEALKQAELSLATYNNLWSNFRLGYVYTEKGHHDAAIRHYRMASEKQEHPYPIHNIAAIYQDWGRYKTARELWCEACAIYSSILTEAINKMDAQFLLHYGDVHCRTLGNRRTGEVLYRIGLELDPSHVGLLISLGTLLKEQTKRPADTSDLAVEPPDHLQWLAQRTFGAALTLMQERMAHDSDAETLIDLARLYLATDQLQEALSAYRKAAKIRPQDPRIQAGMGEAYKRKGQHPEAIRYLKQAVNLKPDDLDIQVKLARAYLEDGQLNAAEAKFHHILDRPPKNHFDAQVGLGEVYIAMAEKSAESNGGDSAVVFWQRAHRRLQSAINLAESKKQIIEKVVTAKDLAPIYYQLGYCCTNQAKSVSRLRQRPLLRDALQNFETSKKRDPTHYQAVRSYEILRDKVRLLPMDRPAQIMASVLVATIAFFLLVVAQVTKFYGWEETGHPSGYMLTQATLTTMTPIPGVLSAETDTFKSKLKPALGKLYPSKEAMVSHLRQLSGDQWVDRYGEVMAQYAFVPACASHRHYLTEGYWVSLSLGAMLFLIAGFCLPHLTSLKVGALRLEKSTLEQVGHSSEVGISIERMMKSTSP